MFGALNVESQCSWAVVQSYTAVADMPVVVLKTLLKPVEFPQVQFLDKVDMPVVCMTGAGFSRQFFLRAHRCESSRAGGWR